MKPLHITSATEQVASYLREQLIAKVWVGTMPGGQVLARQLGVGRMSVDSALSLLEKEGLLVSQGPSRRRRIELPAKLAMPSLRVAILLYEKNDRSLKYLLDCINELKAAGHIAFYAPSTLTEMNMDVKRVAQMVKRVDADAWVVVAGTQGILEWFTNQDTPAIALFGWRINLKIAWIGPDNLNAVVQATRRLIELGHRRIVLLDGQFNHSKPGLAGTAFLAELTAHEISVGLYNMPGWQGGIEGLYAHLESTFQHTPPSAIIVSSTLYYFAILHFLVKNGIRVPQDISIVCIDEDPSFKQCQPQVSHIRWRTRPVVNRIVRWVNHVSQRKEDRRRTTIKAEFFEGGTIGPASNS